MTTEAGQAGGAGPAIACSLDAGSLEERMQEWRTMVGSSVEAIETIEAIEAIEPENGGGGGPAAARAVRLVLADSDEALVRAASLGQREKQCCPFFDVVVEIEAARRSLVLSVPNGAEETLAAFVALLRS